MICESYMMDLSEQLSWRPLLEDSMQISCTDNPTSQRAEIRKINLERAHLPGPLQIANLRIFNSCVKKRNYKASSLRTSSAFRKDA